MPSKIVQEMADEEASIDLTPMIDVVFLLLIFFMCMKFKSYEKKLNSELPDDQGLSSSASIPIDQLRIRLILQPGTTSQVNVIPEPKNPSPRTSYTPIPYIEGSKGREQMFSNLRTQVRANLNYIGDKIEVAPQEQVPFEFVALTLDAIHRAQDEAIQAGEIAEDKRKKITFMAAGPNAQIK